MRVLVVGPHPDDQELGMGGTIARLAALGHEVLLLDLTNGEPTPLGSVEQRGIEAAEALKALSPDAERYPDGKRVRRLLLGLANRSVEHTLGARHAVAGVIRAWQAEVVFTPFFEDAHPDHRAGTRIVEDARFDAKLTKVDMPTPVCGWTGERYELGDPIYPKWLFYYYATHLRWVANPSFVMDVSGFMDQKRDAIRAYHTQFVLPEKNRKVVEWVEASATYLGSRVGVESGEGFFTKEPIGIGDLLALV